MVRGTEGPVKENCWLLNDSDSIVIGAVPVLLIWRVCAAVFPITTLLKSKRVVESASAGAAGGVCEATPMQPESNRERASRMNTAAERSRANTETECGNSTLES